MSEPSGGQPPPMVEPLRTAARGGPLIRSASASTRVRSPRAGRLESTTSIYDVRRTRPRARRDVCRHDTASGQCRQRVVGVGRRAARRAAPRGGAVARHRSPARRILRLGPARLSGDPLDPGTRLFGRLATVLELVSHSGVSVYHWFRAMACYAAPVTRLAALDSRRLSPPVCS